ncbi:hypothetical protein HZH66_011749 [Vespula vulgaris]|uniref:Uncharacterized protein n=1 Tax=Vespula vulgaris TaxID=7454 RepID=A0A834MUK4_VESVU|nr:hypothetical protein HZH66_011749 [Vespula vulgaris]
MNLRGTHAPQVKEKGIKGSSGDDLPPEKWYKAAAFDSGSSHATNFHHSHLNTRGTHAPQVKEKGMKRSGGDTVPLGGDIRRPPLANETVWWGCSATRGDIRRPPLALVGPQMQQPPSGGTWVDSTCDISKFRSRLYHAGTIERMAAYFMGFEIVILKIGSSNETECEQRANRFVKIMTKIDEQKFEILQDLNNVAFENIFKKETDVKANANR